MPTATGNPSTHRLLIIDEDTETHDYLLMLLAPYGYIITSAYSYQQGLDLFQAGGFDITLIELDYPKGKRDGMELLAAILEKKADHPVIVASSQPDVRRCVRVLGAGAREYLIKPIEAEELFAALNRIFQTGKVLTERQRLLDETVSYFEAISSYENAAKLLEIDDFDKLLDSGLDLLTKEVDALGVVLWVQDRPPRGTLNLKHARGLIEVNAEVQKWTVESLGTELGIALSAEATRPIFGKKRKTGEEDRTQIWFALTLDDRRLGLLKVSEPAQTDLFGEAAMTATERIGGFFKSALNNHFRVMKAERQLVESHSTLAYNLMYFADLVDKEVCKSLRYARVLSMAQMRVENMETIRKHFGEPEVEQAMRAITESTRKTLRDADLIGRLDNANYYFLLPETDFFGSLICIHRIRRAISGLTYLADDQRSLPIQLEFSTASFPEHGRTFADLRAATESRLKDLKSSIYQRLSLEDRSFKQSLERLVGSTEDYGPVLDYRDRLPTEESEPPLVAGPNLEMSEDEKGFNRHFVMEESELADLFHFIAQEIHLHPLRRGVLYVGHEFIDPNSRLLSPFKGSKKGETGIFLLGRMQSESAAWLNQEVTLVSLSADDARPFLYMFYLNESYGYALAARKDAQGRYLGLHSADPILIERLVGKLQNEFVLQKGI